MRASRDELPWLPGARYAPHSVLGEGGTAVVYRTFDHDNQAWVAVKMMHTKQAKRQRARQRFLDEARVLQEFDHRNVAKVHEVVGESTRPFFVMELVEGGSLMRWVRQNGAMPPRLAIDAAMQICKGVGAAHAKGIIHRDLKPHNVLVTPQGVCKVIDFGIAQIPRKDGTTDVPDAVSGTSGMNISGTLGYMAPEQRKDPRCVNPRTDVYGVGATLYTLLTGRTVVDLFIAEREPKLLEGLPEPVIPVLRKATAYKPEDRHANVQELSRELFGIRNELELTDRTLSVLPVPPPEPPPRPPAEAPEIPPSDSGALQKKWATTPPTALRDSHPGPTPRPHVPSEPSPRSPWTLMAATLGVALGLTIGALGVGAFSVRSAKSNLDHARKGLYDSLDRELAIVDDLDALGGDGETLERLYKEQRAVDDEARPWVATRYVEALERDVQQRANVKTRDAAKARERFARIDAAHDATAEADAAFHDSATGVLGRLAVRLGLAPKP